MPPSTDERPCVGYCSECGGPVVLRADHAERYLKLWHQKLLAINTSSLAGRRSQLFHATDQRERAPLTFAPAYEKVRYPGCKHVEKVSPVAFRVDDTYWFATSPDEAAVLHTMFYGREPTDVRRVQV